MQVIRCLCVPVIMRHCEVAGVLTPAAWGPAGKVLAVSLLRKPRIGRIARRSSYASACQCADRIAIDCGNFAAKFKIGALGEA